MILRFEINFCIKFGVLEKSYLHQKLAVRFEAVADLLEVDLEVGEADMSGAVRNTRGR